MELTQKELLQLQNTTDVTSTNKPNSTELVRKEHVEGTGFDIVGNEEQGYMIALGNYRLTEWRKTIEECRDMIEKRDWELILGMMGACIQAAETEKEIHSKMYDGVNRTMHIDNKNK